MTGWTVTLDGVTFSGGDDEALGCLTAAPDGLGLPALRTEDVEYPQRDGVRHHSDWYTPRIITLEEVIVCRDSCDDCMSVRQKIREIARAWGRRCDDTELVIWPDCDGVENDLRQNLLIHRPDWRVPDVNDPGWLIGDPGSDPPIGGMIEIFRAEVPDVLTGYRLYTDGEESSVSARYRLAHSDVEPGGTYTVSTWARAGAGSGNLKIGNDTFDLTPEWMRYSSTLSISDTTEMTLYGEADAVAPEQVIRTNESVNPRNTVTPGWSAVQGPPVSATDDLPSMPPGTNITTGAVIIADEEPETVARTNLALNPSYEMTTAPATTGGSALLTVDDDWSVSGTSSLKITPRGQVGSAAYIFGPAAGTSDRLGLVDGRTYTISATIRLTEPQPDDQVYLRRIAVSLTNDQGTDYQWMNSETAPNEAGETRLSVTFTKPAGNVFFRLMNGSATVPVWWDDVLLEESDTAGDYFDGDSEPADDGLRYRWLGEPGQSASEAYVPAAVPSVVAHVQNCDGLGDDAPPRRMGLWVHPTVPDCRARVGGTGDWTDTPAGTWTWVVADDLVSGAAGGTVEVVRDDLPPTGTRTYLTGSYVTFESGDDDAEWSFLLIPDTQKMANTERGLQGYFNGMRQWIIDNRERFGIEFVGGLGDIIDQYGDAESWQNAREALDPLMGLDIPVLILGAGNHDSDTSDQRLRSFTGYNQNFGVDRYQDQPWFGGVYEEGKAQNLYVTFTVAGHDYLAFMLEFYPRGGVYDWVRTVAGDHPDHRVIIITHAFTQPDGTRDTWLSEPYGPKHYFTQGQDDATSSNDAWFTTLRFIPNLYGIFNGHFLAGHVAHRIDHGAGGPVLQGFYNWQETEGGGRGRVVLMTVDERRGTIRQRVVRPDLDAFEEGDSNGFPYSALHALRPATVGPVFFDGASDPQGPWQYRWTGEPGASASEEFIPATVSGSPVIEVAGMMIEEGGTLGDFFDGNTVNTVDHRYGWYGEADASVSFAQHSDSVINGPFGIIGRPRVMEVTWMRSDIGCASLLLRFDGVDQRAHILDPSGEPGSGTQCVTLTPGTSSKCRTYPRCYPMCYDTDTGHVTPATTEVNVIGDVCVYPTITLHGKLTNPAIENITTGEIIAYRGVINADDPPVVIDTATGTATQGGASRTHLLEGNPHWMLDVGVNDLRMLSFSPNDTGYVDICFRPSVEVI